MTYNKAEFFNKSLTTVATLLVVTGICFLFGWSSLFLFFALVTATEAIQLPLRFFIRGLFSREKAIILESILGLIATAVMAQQLFVASCIKLFIFTAVVGAIQAMGAIGIIFLKDVRDKQIEKEYGKESNIEAPAGTQLGPVNEPLSRPTQLAGNSNGSIDSPPPSYQEAENSSNQSQPESLLTSTRKTAARR